MGLRRWIRYGAERLPADDPLASWIVRLRAEAAEPVHISPVAAAERVSAGFGQMGDTMPNTIQLIAALAATAVIGGAATVGTSDQGPVEASAEGAVTAETDIATDVNLRPSSDNVAVETGTDVRADMAGHVATRVEHSPAADIAADAVAHADTVTEATLDAGNSDDDDASDTDEKAEVAAVASSKVEATADDNGSAELGAEFDLNANTDAAVDTPAMSADVDSSAATSLAIGLNG